LDDKTKEKAIEDEIKNKYGTGKGSGGMIIKQISEPATRFVMKLMACKLLRKCHKEESSTSVIKEVAQCTKEILLSWASYLLNLFLDDC